MPLELRLRGKSTTQSYRPAIYYVDLVVQSRFTEAIAHARQLDNEQKASGFDQAALNEAARAGLGNGASEESGEDVSAVVEEFYPGESGRDGDEAGNGTGNASLKSKLTRRSVTRRGNG
ncbi:hypothetical protein [Burkholderia cepacia]|uniref:hypothetical protein n=1 Tax=Burkholderia cepacia TaxID=292 RepID=UPI00299E9887|nr:hypothetical protein [Burkholderia cepacia]